MNIFRRYKVNDAKGIVIAGIKFKHGEIVELNEDVTKYGKRLKALEPEIENEVYDNEVELEDE